MARHDFRCSECGARYAADEVELLCPACAPRRAPGGPLRGVLEVELGELPARWPDAPCGSPEFLGAWLPADATAPWPRLAVGDTPLLEPARLRARLGMPGLFLKDDTRNPSGSTKDRASLLVVTKALELGRDTVACASTGNAATALSALCAAAGLRAVVCVPADAPEAKLVQMLSYGADVVPVAGSYDDAFELCMAACARFGWYDRNTALNPYTTEGKKTVALEMARALGPRCADAVVVPTGDGVILAGVAKGFADAFASGLIERVPRLIAVQPEGCDAIVRALESGAADITPVDGASSVADSLVVGAPRNARLCLRRVRESGGAGVRVPDEAIVRAIGELAAGSGVFAEPAAAAGLAGLHAALERGLVSRDERVVLLVTGTGLKDVPAAARGVRRPEPVAPTLEALAAAVGA